MAKPTVTYSLSSLLVSLVAMLMFPSRNTQIGEAGSLFFSSGSTITGEAMVATTSRRRVSKDCVRMFSEFLLMLLSDRLAR